VTWPTYKVELNGRDPESKKTKPHCNRAPVERHLFSDRNNALTRHLEDRPKG